MYNIAGYKVTNLTLPGYIFTYDPIPTDLFMIIIWLHTQPGDKPRIPSAYIRRQFSGYPTDIHRTDGLGLLSLLIIQR